MWAEQAALQGRATRRAATMNREEALTCGWWPAKGGVFAKKKKKGLPPQGPSGGSLQKG